MISDTELNTWTVYFGMLSMGLILTYSVLESNFRGKGVGKGGDN